MNIVRNIRLGLIHTAVAVALVPITGVLNRIMIYELGILSTVVAALVIVPYVFSPLQVWVGQYSDTHPLWGYRRTPYIALGIGLCVGGAVLTPHAALLMAHNAVQGWLLALVAFGGWGIGFNLAAVSYLSLSSDLSGEDERTRTIATMWFMMIVGVIGTAIITGRALETYSDQQLVRVFNGTGLVALALAALGLVGLEPRHQTLRPQHRRSQRAALRLIIGNGQARMFFCYLILLLAAILGQDILLEPFGAEAFGMSVRQTTQLTATWGGMTLVALVVQGVVLSKRLPKKTAAALGGVVAALGLLLIAASGMFAMQALFVPGVATLGFGTGIATASNLALMLDMTTTEQAGLYIGAWGVADAIARGTGTLLGGVVRDLIARGTGSAGSGYISVFLLQALLLGVSLVLLRRIDTASFRSQQPTLTELVALTGEAG